MNSQSLTNFSNKKATFKSQLDGVTRKLLNSKSRAELLHHKGQLDWLSKYAHSEIEISKLTDAVSLYAELEETRFAKKERLGTAKSHKAKSKGIAKLNEVLELFHAGEIELTEQEQLEVGFSIGSLARCSSRTLNEINAKRCGLFTDVPLKVQISQKKDSFDVHALGLAHCGSYTCPICSTQKSLVTTAQHQQYLVQYAQRFEDKHCYMYTLNTSHNKHTPLDVQYRDVVDLMLALLTKWESLLKDYRRKGVALDEHNSCMMYSFENTITENGNNLHIHVFLAVETAEQAKKFAEGYWEAKEEQERTTKNVMPQQDREKTVIPISIPEHDKKTTLNLFGERVDFSGKPWNKKEEILKVIEYISKGMAEATGQAFKTNLGNGSYSTFDFSTVENALAYAKLNYFFRVTKSALRGKLWRDPRKEEDEYQVYKTIRESNRYGSIREAIKNLTETNELYTPLVTAIENATEEVLASYTDEEKEMLLQPLIKAQSSAIKSVLSKFINANPSEILVPLLFAQERAITKELTKFAVTDKDKILTELMKANKASIAKVIEDFEGETLQKEIEEQLEEYERNTIISISDVDMQKAFLQGGYLKRMMCVAAGSDCVDDAEHQISAIALEFEQNWAEYSQKINLRNQGARSRLDNKGSRADKGISQVEFEESNLPGYWADPLFKQSFYEFGDGQHWISDCQDVYGQEYWRRIRIQRKDGEYRYLVVDLENNQALDELNPFDVFEGKVAYLPTLWKEMDSRNPIS